MVWKLPRPEICPLQTKSLFQTRPQYRDSQDGWTRMPTKAHLLLSVPDDWDNDQRGEFFEKFVSGLLRPMRFEVTQRLRFTGMEIDVLARGLDHPKTVLVECKAQRDPVSADVISKLLGNVGIRHA